MATTRPPSVKRPSIVHRIINNNRFIWVGFFLTTLLLYANTIQSGFTTDVTGGIERLSTRPFKDILISFGFPALNQLSVALFYIQ